MSAVGVCLHATRAECAEALRRIRTLLEVTKVSREYQDQGEGGQVRVYLEVRL